MIYLSSTTSSLCLFFVVLALFFPVRAQSPGVPAAVPLPPLQWLNLSGLLTGPSPPPLKDSSIAYDETTRSLIVFGGESEGGFVQSQTYLLNLDTLTWSTPSPPATLHSSPSARTLALAGNDFAASNRHGFVVYGGKGADGHALSDVWEFDYNNQFWSEVILSPGGPSPRWGASGGIDTRSVPSQDPVVPGPNNTFYLAGGYDGSISRPLSDIWMLKLSGTLSSNMPNTAMGSWVNVSFGNLPSTLGQASTMLHQQLIVAGGCSDPSSSNDSCAEQVSHIIDPGQKIFISPGPCPAPRLGANLVSNVNSFSSTFSSQVFLLLGTFNMSMWHDDGGLLKGEVAVLDVNTGSWGRVLPSGDPGDNGKPSFPSPREGAAAYAHTSALVGNSRSSASDTIVFGGRDASGRYLSEVWLLSGHLQTGINANGVGVTLQYMPSCASAVNSSRGSGTPSRSPSGSSPMDTNFDTSLIHKIMAPVSIALLLPSVFVFRLVSPSFQLDPPSDQPIPLVYLPIITALIAYGAGVVGLATAFATIRCSDPSISCSHVTLKTAHGKAGLVLFVGLYAVIPALYLFSVCFSRLRSRESTDQMSEKSLPTRSRFNSDGSDQGQTRGISQTIKTSSRPPSSPCPRVFSWAKVGLWCRSHEEPVLNNDDSVLATPATPRFEVLNRPTRTRTRTHTTSTSWLVAAATESQQLASVSPTLPDLRDIEWLRRRRSLNVVDELDYAITQAQRAQTQNTTDAAAHTLTTPTTPTPSQPVMPDFMDVLLRLIFYSFLVALCVFSLFALWSRAPRVFFAIFLSWTLSFYVSMFVLAWLGKPQKSIAATIISRLRAHPITDPSAPHEANQASEPQPGVNQVPFPTNPYLNQPPYTPILPVTPASPRSAETNSDDDEDEDEHARQRRIEDEMSRRDVSIVTVPKRRLWIANPS